MIDRPSGPECPDEVQESDSPVGNCHCLLLKRRSGALTRRWRVERPRWVGKRLLLPLLVGRRLPIDLGHGLRPIRGSRAGESAAGRILGDERPDFREEPREVRVAIEAVGFELLRYCRTVLQRGLLQIERTWQRVWSNLRRRTPDRPSALQVVDPLRCIAFRDLASLFLRALTCISRSACACLVEMPMAGARA
jgi:hypothetical protein